MARRWQMGGPVGTETPEPGEVYAPGGRVWIAPVPVQAVMHASATGCRPVQYGPSEWPQPGPGTTLCPECFPARRRRWPIRVLIWGTFWRRRTGVLGAGVEVIAWLFALATVLRLLNAVLGLLLWLGRQ